MCLVLGSNTGRTFLSRDTDATDAVTLGFQKNWILVRHQRYVPVVRALTGISHAYKIRNRKGV